MSERSHPPRYRVVAVCAGNICRSPIAEAVLARAFADAGLDAVEVVSAGTGGWHVGDDADPRSLAVLRARGYELDHVAQQFDPRWFERDGDWSADLILALDAENYRSLRRLADRHGVPADGIRMLRSFDPTLAALPDTDSMLEVPDPYYESQRAFVEVLNMVEGAAPGVVAWVRVQLS